jgi:NADP-dependent 3-hydroxy acid dehydrogenase YdfG
MNKVWIITGCSTGFGRQLAQLTLSLGHKVVVTARKVEDILDIVADYPEQSLALKLDVTVDHDIEVAVQATIEKFGKVDVLVNNAGIGYFGSIEESEEVEVRRMFEINFWGLMKMTQHVLPHMRKQRSGHILNIASIAGLVGFPAVGFYNATKFAVDGISESLQKEVAHLGIKVTIISPSGFRTDWAGRSAVETNTQIEDLLETLGFGEDSDKPYFGHNFNIIN